MRICLLLILSFLIPSAFSQPIGIDVNKEQELYKATKQVNQFFHRFNGEETPKGERLYPGDPDYRNLDFRKKYLEMLIDPKVDKALKGEFTTSLLRKNPFFLEFHNGQWFAELKTTFLLRGKEELFILFLSIQQEEIGSKWVIANVYNRALSRLFETDSLALSKFIHPMSHELDFMNLTRIFREGSITPYLAGDWQPDYLSILSYEHAIGNLKFQQIQHIKFHFFQVPDWYFEITNVQRDREHSGWLITRLMRMPDLEKDAYLNLILFDKAN